MPGAIVGSTRRHWPRAICAAAAALILAVAGDAALARRDPAAQTVGDLGVYAVPTALFGAGEVAHPPANDFAKWTDTLARYERDRLEEAELCAAGDCALVQWRAYLETLRGLEPIAQLRAINDHMNRYPYRTDLENYGVEDYWATPREFFARGGDCEDYAIAKYLSLRALGWPAERLRLAVVHDTARDLVHAVLIAYQGGNAYVLDIEITEVTEQRAITRYLPIFSISENGWWSYKSVVPVEIAAAGAKAGDRGAEAPPSRPPQPPHLRHQLGHPARLAARQQPAQKAGGQ